MIAWFYWSDTRIGPKPLSTLVCNIVSQGGTNNNDEIEMIEVLSLSLSQASPRLSVSFLILLEPQTTSYEVLSLVMLCP